MMEEKQETEKNREAALILDAEDAAQDTAGDGEGTPEEDGGGEKEGKSRRGKGRKADSEPDIPVGAVRISEGRETVKVGADDWRPVVRLDPPPLPQTDTADTGTVRIKHEDLKGQKILLGNGETAVFDKNGVIEVSRSEAERLLTIPGYETA